MDPAGLPAWAHPLARRFGIRCLPGLRVASISLVSPHVFQNTLGDAMNHIYRLCWNRSLRQWVVASELATRRAGRGASRAGKGVRRVVVWLLAGVPVLLIAPAYGAGGPSGGQIVSGVGSISQSGALTTIQQRSPTLQLNWQSFNVGAGQTVDFVQPGRNALAVNRIFGSTPSAIIGRLNANGQVWLINPNGVLFGPSAREVGS